MDSSGQPGVLGQRLAWLSLLCAVIRLDAWVSLYVQLHPSPCPAGSSGGAAFKNWCFGKRTIQNVCVLPPGVQC